VVLRRAKFREPASQREADQYGPTGRRERKDYQAFTLHHTAI
jgi:hypothetical protein